ncbi:MAG: ABC transporter permease [Desulfurococcales archaeon]|nr:ABC transporter permease [Desulfurococcales archaeon]
MSWLASLPLILFLVVFFYAPFAVLAYYSVQTDHGLGFDNYLALVTDRTYIMVAAKSLLLAGEVTVATLLLSLPLVIYISVHASSRERTAILGLVIIPFWIDVLLRAIALRTVLESIGVREGYAAMLAGMVYEMLPLMILPMYASSRRVTRSIIDAARTAGAGWGTVVARIVLPLLAPGIVAGSLLVMLMSLTEFVIPALLGGVSGFTLGSLIYHVFLSSGLWGVGAALTVVVVLVLGIMSAVAASRVGGGLEP